MKTERRVERVIQRGGQGRVRVSDSVGRREIGQD